MKARFLLVLTMMIALSVVGYGQSGAAGTWQGEQAGRGGGPAAPFVVMLNVDGSAISGTVQETPNDIVLEISEGTVDGETATFKTARAFGEGELIVTWTGVIDGDSMSLTRAFEFPEGGGFGGG